MALIYFLALLTLFAQAANVQTQCIAQSPDTYGNQTGNEFNDKNLLGYSSNYYILKLWSLQFCQSPRLGFTGMKGVVALYDPVFLNATGEYIPTLDVGRTEDCRDTIKFDLDKNETVS